MTTQACSALAESVHTSHQNREQFLAAGFIAESHRPGHRMRNARGIRLTGTPAENGVAIEADRQVLACGLPSV